MIMISIIIPVYNTEKYLSMCVESILAQNYEDWELLLIDDGSTDQSSLICDDYALRDSRISVFHQMNSGVAAARNKGLDEASGKWILFIDSDDMLAMRESLDILMRYAIEDKYDVISGACLTCYGCQKQDRILRGQQEILKATYEGVESTTPWNHLIRHDIIIQYNIRFPVGLSIAEDTFFMFNLLKNCSVVRLLPDNLYFYRISEDSLLRPKNRQRLIRKYDDMVKSVGLFAKEYGYDSRYSIIYLEQMRLNSCVDIYQNCSIGLFQVYFRKLHAGVPKFNSLMLSNWKLQILACYRILPKRLQYIGCRCVFAVFLRKRV